MATDLGSLLLNVGYAVIIGIGGFVVRKLGSGLRVRRGNYQDQPRPREEKLMEEARAGLQYQAAPQRAPGVPNVLHYPAQPEPDPEPSPLALLNRRWDNTSLRVSGSRLKEPPKPFRLRERPMKLPAVNKAYQAEPESPVEKLPAAFANEEWTRAKWLECPGPVRDPDILPGYGWATPEQRDWIQELKQQLIDRGEARCSRSVTEWTLDEYKEKFGDLDLLVWNAVRTGMSMFDFISMMQWERENGIGLGLFNTGSGFSYRGSSGF